MRKGIVVDVKAEDRARLAAIVANRNSPQKHVWRARIVLLTADGLGTAAIMRQTGKSKSVVWRWQERFMQAGVYGLLRDKTRPSRKPPLDKTVIARVVELTAGDPPGEATHWTAAAMAKATGLSVSSVQRIWRSHGLAPHRLRQFKLSNDPKFADTLKDVVGLYVDPPAHAVVLSVDEKSQIQALDRPARPADEETPSRHDDPRLPAQRHDHAVRRIEGPGRYRHRPLHAAPSASGVHPLPQCRRGAGAGRQDRSSHSRQLRHPQASEGDGLARPASPLRLSLNVDLGIVAQRGRGLLRQTHSAAAQTRCLPLHLRSPGRHQPLHRRGQWRSQALRLDGRPGQNHRRRQKRAPSVRVDQLRRTIMDAKTLSIIGAVVAVSVGALGPA